MTVEEFKVNIVPMLKAKYDCPDLEETMDDYYFNEMLEDFISEHREDVENLLADIADVCDWEPREPEEELPEIDVLPNKWELMDAQGGPGVKNFLPEERLAWDDRDDEFNEEDFYGGD